MNRLVENKSTPLSQTLDLIKKTGEPSEMIKQFTAMGNAKRLFDQLKSQSAQKVAIGGSLALLGSKYTIDCMELGDTTKFVIIMTTVRVKALGLKSLLESGMKTAQAVEWIHRQSVKTVYSLLELVKSTPEQTINVKIVEILETG